MWHSLLGKVKKCNCVLKLLSWIFLFSPQSPQASLPTQRRKAHWPTLTAGKLQTLSSWFSPSSDHPIASGPGKHMLTTFLRITSTTGVSLTPQFYHSSLFSFWSLLQSQPGIMYHGILALAPWKQRFRHSVAMMYIVQCTITNGIIIAD